MLNVHRFGNLMMNPKCLLLAASVLLAPLPALAADPGLDEVLARHFQARGGVAAIAAVNGYRSTGTMSMGPLPAAFVTEAKRPGKLRMEFTLQGMTGVQAVDGDNGWQFMPFMGHTSPQPMNSDDLRNFQNQADIDGPLVDWQAKGHSVSLIGATELDGVAVYQLKIELRSGDVITSHLDADTFLDRQWNIQASMQGRPVHVTLTFDDHKPVGDLVLPHRMSQSVEGMPGAQNFVIDTYEINVDLSDDRFHMPATAEAP